MPAKIILTLILSFVSANFAAAQTTAFTYQGRLTDSGSATNGNYEMQFRLFDNPNVGQGTQQGATVTVASVTATNGIFTVQLDFGSAVLAAGADLFLEISLRPAGSAGGFTLLAPRQRLTSAPYAVRANGAGAADSLSAVCVECVIDGKIASISGAKVTGSVAQANAATTATTAGNVTGIVAVANGGTGSSTRNYVDLTSTENVGGTKTFTSPVNTSTQYNIGGSRVLSVAGTFNLFAGVSAGTGASNTGLGNAFVGAGAGLANTSGSFNVFTGISAGTSNTTGSNNSLVGAEVGLTNQTGRDNSFFGAFAGRANTTGSSNSFFGRNAGIGNSVGESNTVMGNQADLNANNRLFASAIGANAFATADDQIVLGKVAGTYLANGVNGFRPADTVRIPGNLVVVGTLTAAIDGAGITNLNASNITTGTLPNARLGIVPIANGGTGSGTQNFVDLTTAQTITGDKTFSNAVNTSAQYKIGGSRVLGIAGTNNLFAGIDAGAANTAGGSNSFIGSNAGYNNSMGNNNSFVGRDAGYNNIGGGANSFLGVSAGYFNSDGISNSFFGASAGLNNTTGNNNTAVGQSADFGSDALTFATAIGAGTIVYASNSVVLGRTADTVRIPGNLVVTGSITGATKSFKIDYPLDPANKTLTYTSIESPDIKNIYDGNVTTDGGGEATVTLPDYFEELNKDYRYQLTVIGTFAQAIVSDEIKGNSFKIKTDKPGVKVSWQVTGIRRDKFAEDNRAPNVQDKPESERGTCLYAPACGAESTGETRIKPRP